MNRSTLSGRKPHEVEKHIEHVPGKPILSVNRLSVKYAEVTALDAIQFELNEGDRLAVVGPNGAGKSTLFKVIAGQIKPALGTIEIAGQDPRVHLCIAYIPQRSLVDWNFPVTVASVVMMGRTGRLGLLRWPGESDRQIVRQALETVRLETLSERQISQLSGGQQQRMFIAQALAQHAELMLMDEPFSGLDKPSQEELFKILDELQSEKVTVMIALHDLKMASEHFNKVLILNHQQLGFGSPSEVLREEILQNAYSGKLQVMPSANGIAAFDDTCCGEEEDHHA